MLLHRSCILSDFISEKSLSQYIEKLPKLAENDIESSSLHKPDILSVPLIPILFQYSFEQNTTMNVDLDFQIVIKKDALKYRICQEQRIDGAIYKLIYLENCECFSSLITIQIGIRVSNSGQKNKVDSYEQLTQTLLQKNLSFYTQQSFQTIRKPFIIIEPVEVVFRYCKEGYFYFKLDNSERTNNTVFIFCLQIMNWLSEDSELASFVMTSTLKQTVELQPEESYALIVTAPKNLQNVAFPYSITYSLNGWKEHRFKIIKKMQI